MTNHITTMRMNEVLPHLPLPEDEVRRSWALEHMVFFTVDGDMSTDVLVDNLSGNGVQDVLSTNRGSYSYVLEYDDEVRGVEMGLDGYRAFVSSGITSAQLAGGSARPVVENHAQGTPPNIPGEETVVELPYNEAFSYYPPVARRVSRLDRYSN